jgi:hypothetical protein
MRQGVAGCLNRLREFGHNRPGQSGREHICLIMLLCVRRFIGSQVCPRDRRVRHLWFEATDLAHDDGVQHAIGCAWERQHVMGSAKPPDRDDQLSALDVVLRERPDQSLGRLRDRLEACVRVERPENLKAGTAPSALDSKHAARADEHAHHAAHRRTPIEL